MSAPIWQTTLFLPRNLVSPFVMYYLSPSLPFLLSFNLDWKNSRPTIGSPQISFPNRCDSFRKWPTSQSARPSFLPQTFPSTFRLLRSGVSRESAKTNGGNSGKQIRRRDGCRFVLFGRTWKKKGGKWAPSAKLLSLKTLGKLLRLLCIPGEREKNRVYFQYMSRGDVGSYIRYTHTQGSGGKTKKRS